MIILIDSNLEALLDLFNLEPQDVQSFKCIRDQDRLIFMVVLKALAQECPTCHSNHCVVHCYVNKNIKHQAVANENTIVLYKARRYKCKECGRTFYEHNPFVFGGQKISALTVKHVLEDLKSYHATFSEVARTYSISPTTVASIFDTHVEISRKPLPKQINFDEVYAFTSKLNGYTSKFVCVLLDHEKQVPVDVLPARTYSYLSEYFSNIPYEERCNVEICCTDMLKTFRKIIKTYLPNSIQAVDHYHISQEAHRQVQQVRIRTMKGYKTDDVEYYLLKKFNWLIIKNSIIDSQEAAKKRKKRKNKKPKSDKDLALFDENRTKYFNKKLNKFANFADIREEMEKIPNIKEIWDLKDDLDKFYATNTYESAPEALTELIKKFKKSKIPEMNSIGGTLSNWKQEVINSFLVVKLEYEINDKTGEVTRIPKHISNAIIENRNAIIKCVKKNANGYRNWDRFRNRIMYVLDPKATYALNPMYQSKQISQKRLEWEKQQKQKAAKKKAKAKKRKKK